jgi:16S rRNA (cytosine967-C5)-methyltransferase
MIAPARRISYQILLQISTSDAHSDDLLRSREVDALSKQDRALTTTLVLGTLRWQLLLDARIRELLSRPDTKLRPEAATALQMGAYQLLYLDRVPAHAVIHDSVELVKMSPDRGAAGMVNAVLRKVQRSEANVQTFGRHSRSDNQRSVVVHRGGNATRGLDAAVLAHPAWMVERWTKRYGAEATAAICQWNQEPAGVTLRAEASDPPADLETEPGYFLAVARRVVRGDVSSSAAVRGGHARIQDEASQLVAELLAARSSGETRSIQNAEFNPSTAPQGLRVMDLCAAPGGKTAILAQRLPEAEITAMDVSRKRLEGMKKTMPEALARRLRFEVADAAKIDLEPAWDLILCDVPCSGTGTMARNPEIRQRVTESDLARQHARQVAILRAGLRGLKPGGRLVYSTCSLESEENEAVLSEVLLSAEEFTMIPVAGVLDQLEANNVVTKEGRDRLRGATMGQFLRTLPGVQPCDGFFAAVIERTISTPTDCGRGAVPQDGQAV